ncbi:CARDB domain-containing protein [Persicimonas caeni]|nr:CARDB domain-containing protein [Persicimonas caeni]
MTKVRAMLLVLLLLPLALVSTSCGGDDGEKTAEVEITSIEPASSYPGVETAISFTITPGEGTSASELSWTVDFGDNQTASGEELEDTVTHVYENSGQYRVEVVALAGGSEVGSATSTVRVLAPVDLAISETRGSPANVQTGDTLTVSFEVANQVAGAVESPFDVSVYLSPSASVTVDDLEGLPLLATTTVSASQEGEPVIAAGESVSAGLSAEVPSDVSSGDYHLVSWINPEGQLADSEPGNNLDVAQGIVRVENPDEVLPDLAVTDVLIIPDRAFPTLNQLTRSFTVANRGNVEAFDVVAKVWLSQGDAELDESSDMLLEKTDPFNVPPNDKVVFDPEEFVLDNEIAPTPGEELEVYMIVEVAIQGDSTEANLDNNVGASPNPTVVSDERVDGTDIVVRDFSVTPNSTFLDGTLEATLVVANEGTLDASSFFCGIYLGDEPAVNTDLDPRLSNINISGIDSDTEQTIEQSFVVPALYDPGTYYMYVVCDPLGALSEPYRSNNQKVYLEPVTITDEADVDLYVDSLTVPSTANEGDTVDLTATICVSGSNPSGTTRGRLWRSPNAAPDFTEDPIAEFDIPNINPGGCEDVTIQTDASCADFVAEYGYAIEVDYQDRLPESDEDNNTATGSNLLDVSGEFCSCTADAYANDASNQPLPLTAGQFSDAVCDPEICDWYAADLQQNESLLVTTTFDANQGQLETRLYDSSGSNELDSSVADGRQEVATFLVPSAGRYLFKVCGETPDIQNLYDVDVEILSPSPGVDVLPRELEVPQRDSFSIGAQLDISFRVYNIGQTATSGAFDANLVISPNDVIGDGDDIPLQPTSVSVSQVSGGGSKDVSATVEIPTSVNDGDYYIGVQLDIADGDTTNNAVASKMITVETLCYDPLEPNDSFADAPSMSAGSYSNLTACTAADDYYKLCVQNGKKFTLRADFFDSQGDIDIELFDQQRQIIDSSANSGVDSESVSVDYVNGDQCYYARVYLLTLQQDLQTSYDMSINVSNVDPSLQCDGYFEPNDTTSSAASLLAALQHTNTLDRCPASDTDYYYVSLSSGQTVSLRGLLEPSTQAGTLRIQLYQPNGTPGPNMETAPGAPVAEIANYTAPTSGTYYLQVTLSGTQRRATYTLEADGIGGIDLEASNLLIGPGTYRANDEVRFGFDLANLRSDPATAPTYTVWLGTAQAHDPNADIQLGSFSLSSDVAGNSSTSIADRVDLPSSGLWDGTGYLHVVVEANGQTDPNPGNNTTTTTIDLSTN